MLGAGARGVLVVAVCIIMAFIPLAPAEASLHSSSHTSYIAYVATTTSTRTVTGSTTSTGTVIPINLATGVSGRPIAVPGGLGYISITANGKTVYGTSNSLNAVLRIDLATGKASAVGVFLQSIEGVAVAPTPNGRTAYVTTANDAITPLNLASRALAKPISVPNKGLGLSGIAIATDGNTAYVASYNNDGNTASGALTPINLAAGTAMKPILVPPSGGPYGGGLYGIAITSDGHAAYVTGLSTPSGSSTSAPSSFLASVNLSSGSVGGLITLPSNYGCVGLALVPNGSTAYVACDSLNSGGQISSSVIAPVDLTTKTIGKPIQLPGVEVSGNCHGSGPRCSPSLPPAGPRQAQRDLRAARHWVSLRLRVELLMVTAGLAQHQACLRSLRSRCQALIRQTFRLRQAIPLQHFAPVDGPCSRISRCRREAAPASLCSSEVVLDGTYSGWEPCPEGDLDMTHVSNTQRQPFKHSVLTSAAIDTATVTYANHVLGVSHCDIGCKATSLGAPVPDVVAKHEISTRISCEGIVVSDLKRGASVAYLCDK